METLSDFADVPLYVLPSPKRSSSTYSNITMSNEDLDPWGNSANSMRFAPELVATAEEGEEEKPNVQPKAKRFDSSLVANKFSTLRPLAKPERKTSRGSSMPTSNNSSVAEQKNASLTNKCVDRSPGMPCRRPSDPPARACQPASASAAVTTLPDFKSMKLPAKPVRQLTGEGNRKLPVS